MTGPRVWQLPPEPWPEVTAVRGRNGELWLRAPGFNRWRYEHAGQNAAYPWLTVLELYGPLTDASDEVTP